MSNSGYMELPLCKGGVKQFFFVHRLVALAFIPNPSNKPFVNHIDANKTNNLLQNLEWVTPMESTAHATSLGLMEHRAGERNNFAKINRGIAMDIFLSPESQKNAAALFGISPGLVSAIRRKRVWRHIHAT